MNSIQLTGTLLRQLSLKQDKNQQDYYLGRLICDDGSQHFFFFFHPTYDLSLRLVELETNQKITLQGYWGKNQAFLATDFYLAEFKTDNFYSTAENN